MKHVEDEAAEAAMCPIQLLLLLLQEFFPFPNCQLLLFRAKQKLKQKSKSLVKGKRTKQVTLKFELTVLCGKNNTILVKKMFWGQSQVTKWSKNVGI